MRVLVFPERTQRHILKVKVAQLVCCLQAQSFHLAGCTSSAPLVSYFDLATSNQRKILQVPEIRCLKMQTKTPCSIKEKTSSLESCVTTRSKTTPSSCIRSVDDFKRLNNNFDTIPNAQISTVRSYHHNCTIHPPISSSSSLRQSEVWLCSID